MPRVRAALGALATVLLLLACSACQAQSTYAGWSGTTTSFDPVETSLNGGFLGWNYNLPEGQKSFAELVYQQNLDDTLRFSSIRSGLLGPPSTAGPLDVRGRMDFGYTWARYEPYENSNRLLSLGLSIQGDLNLSDDLALVVRAGYRFYFDQTSKPRCADGTLPREEGQAACFDHGGLAFSPDRLGDGHGVELTIGVLFRH